MASNLATPGVYIEEKVLFGTSVVPVATAIPGFVGYTEMALRGTKSLTNVPTKISNFENLLSYLVAHQILFSISQPDKPNQSRQLKRVMHLRQNKMLTSQVQ